MDLYGLLLASSLPALFTVGILRSLTAMSSTRSGRSDLITLISTVTTNLLTDLMAPAFLELGQKIKLIDKAPDNLVCGRRAVLRARAPAALAPIPEEINPRVESPQRTVSTSVNVPDEIDLFLPEREKNKTKQKMGTAVEEIAKGRRTLSFLSIQSCS